MSTVVTHWPLLFSALVVIPAFAVRSTTGFGGSIIALPLMALVLPVHVALPVITILNLISALQQVRGNLQLVVWRELLRIAPWMVIGIVIGLYFFRELQGPMLQQALGYFLCGYATYSLLKTYGGGALSPRRIALPVVIALSTTGGVAGALFGASTPFYAIYFAALNAARDTFRITLTVLLLLQHTIRVSGYAWMGAYDSYALLLLLAVLPSTYIGTRLGGAIATRIDAARFKQVIALLVMFCGAALIVRA
jgi:uncharacterized protein